jgi:thiol-disulfide isomerase/thioredoxin
MIRNTNLPIRAIGIYLLLLLLIGCNANRDNKPEAIKLNDIDLTDLKSQPIDQHQLQGKVVFINFWATWCRPCIEEMPTIIKLQDKLKEENIEFFFASDEELERIETFATKRGMNANFVRVDNPEALGIQALPTTYIFDAKGELVFSEVGFRNWTDETSVEIVKKLISNND